MITNNSFSIQRVKTLVLKDTICSFSFFWILMIVYVLILAHTAITNIGRDYAVALPELARVYGIADRPTDDGFFATIVLITMVFTTYIKFSSKKYSTLYRLCPATSWEKCIAIVCEYLLIIACCYILKAIFCLGYGLSKSGLQMGIDTVKYMICSRPEGWGISVSPAANLNCDPKNMMFSCNYWPMAKIGIPCWQSFDTNVIYNSGCNLAVISNWSQYPVLAMGLNFVEFLHTALNVLLTVALFSFVKPGKRFFTSIGFKFYGLLILLSVFLLLFALGIGSKTPLAPLLIFRSILQGFGPWCWMSMYGWMIQAAILIFFNGLVVYYIYHRIKTI